MTTIVELLDEAQEHKDYKANSLWRLTLRRLFRQRSAIAGLSILTVLLLVAILAPALAPYEPTKVLIGLEDVKKREAPCIHALGCPAELPQHIMGVDGNVRDVYSRILYGTRVSLRVGVIIISVAVITGTFLGSVAGYAGGLLDDAIMRVLDVVLAFPSLLLAIAIVFVLGPGLTNAMLAVSIVNIPTYARIVRATVLSVRELDFVEASRALGAGPAWILFRRILPNALPPLIVQATLGIGIVIIDVAGLSFLGIGAQPPVPEWGTMLSAERNQLFSAPHLVFFPGIAISLTVLAFNLLGDGLRDALDPRLVNVREG